MHFSDGDISDFQQAKFSTSTIWTDDSLRFSRPCLATLLSHAGAGSGDVVLRAENDYDIRLPREMVAPDAPIIANRIDGAPSSMRDQRPLWLVFPYDSNKRYRTESIYAFSVWQLIGLSVLPE
ncbi:hypothetical protein [Pseudogemmobacter sp. W21_MBD1_M6]|uniref:hypothetical protein n=1 Tax=Pseudogemmobacter sp. W21_MBD1_M6 TaxID=3240271 RepID=UPI003F95D583